MIATNKKPAKLVNKKSANAVLRSAENWDSIKWSYHRTIVKKLQLRIAKATQLKKFRKVKTLQWLLTHSFSAKLLAVRNVMQNKGSKTPGVDGIIIKTPEEKLTLAKNMKRRGYQPSPLRRIYIPKAGNMKKLRPLGIPTITDRCQQALYTLALIPVSEVTADLNSYGFRPQRSCADAIAQSFITLARRGSPTWILEGDIKGCFDHISHEWMDNNICLDKVIMNKWLKAGFIETGKLFPSLDGIPQGGMVSPVMCNMTLDGIAQMLANNFKQHKGITFIRYADDFIVTGHSKETLEKEVKPAITAFLKERGLELSEEKTKVTHITEGFDFLGQNVRKYPSRGKLKLLIKPSEKNIHSFLENIRELFHLARSTTQAQLIQKLNPKIRGWANFHRGVVSKKTFSRIDNEIWHLSLRWAKRRHSNKSVKWILSKYYKRIKGVNHRFSGNDLQKNGILQEVPLFLMSYTSIRRHVKILKSAHPFDIKYDEYFEMRTSEKWKYNSQRLNIEKHIGNFQKGKCPCCLEELKVNQNWCISLRRKASKGGEYKSENMNVIHKKCYEKWQTKTLHM
ncbi:group II intron reverse transcriptase/maturase [Chitinophaga sp. LS1]|uniref:group II intron reverse transcriptase/maturase n=1 Tax=Chitinophaga sp. LS1 TaxID=3051176 RepID=UPI002AAA80D5|nr:group II intron reverse transcriptase/maturase [Chitinophaga sp. LS1]WPV67051.1 group II intron reverse transcriptase/maturase [Chitinophaga sp. LS1]WPV67817.1 group II intron reverse transcriptase/maturase [Chitinophaga sp. LS1]